MGLMTARAKIATAKDQKSARTPFWYDADVSEGTACMILMTRDCGVPDERVGYCFYSSSARGWREKARGLQNRERCGKGGEDEDEATPNVEMRTRECDAGGRGGGG